MKKLITLAIAAAVVLPVLVSAQAEGYYDRSYNRLSYVKGDVYVQRAQDLGYEQGEVNLVIVAGDKLGTREGRAEIQLGRGNLLRLDFNTQVDIVGLPNQDYDPTKLHILNGSVFLRVRTLDREKNIEIHTPDASFYILDAGLYRINVRENRQTEFSVLSGQAEVAGEEGSVLVKEGKMILVSDGRFDSEPMFLQDGRDDFTSWNESRDSLYARKLDRTYLPAEYAEYDSELSDNGRWAYESSYGNVWVPNVNYNDWRPYSSGRWAWYPIIGWTWISSEPWGWCTSHYGRWGWRGGLGWYWIPTSRWSWGPAWVHWYHGYDHIGWCPLSYYNRPGVIINNIFYDRYDRDYFPNHSKTLVMVNRNQLQNRQLSRIALNENTVRNLGKISLRSAQPNVRPSLSRDSQVAAQAQKVLRRETLRSVGKNFSSEGRKLTPSDLRSAPIRKSESGDSSQGRVIKGRESGISRDSLSTGRGIERESENSSRKITERTIRSKSEGKSGDVSPSRLQPNPSSKSGDADRPARTIKESGKKEGETTGPVKKKDEQGASQSRVIRERAGSSRAYSESSSLRRSTVPENGNRMISRFESRSSHSSSLPRISTPTPRPSLSSGRSSSRSIEPPSRSSMSAPTRSSSSPSRSYTSPSRSSSGSSRSSSAPSRSSMSAPTRSSSSPSRSYTSPSRSSSGSGRSSSAPSRSSISAPSRSSSSSTSSSRGSTGSKSSGPTRRK